MGSQGTVQLWGDMYVPSGVAMWFDYAYQGDPGESDIYFWEGPKASASMLIQTWACVLVNRALRDISGKHANGSPPLS